jgi:hypothetical protein
VVTVQEPAEIYLDYVKWMLQNEVSRREALERRISTVITLSGTLVTLMVGIIAIVIRSAHVPTSIIVGLGAAGCLFVLAAAVGVVVPSLPWRYAIENRSPDLLPTVNPDLFRKLPSGSPDAAIGNVADAWLQIIEGYQHLSVVNSLTLLLAGILQVCAMASLVAVIFMIIGS